MKRPSITNPSAKPGLPLVPRVFAVAAAVLLVGSVALVALLPPDITLAQALHAISEDMPFRLQSVVVGVLGHGVWSALVAPVLARPVWLMPVCLGIVCVGVAVTAPMGKRKSTSR